MSQEITDEEVAMAERGLALTKQVLFILKDESLPMMLSVLGQTLEKICFATPKPLMVLLKFQGCLEHIVKPEMINAVLDNSLDKSRGMR